MRQNIAAGNWKMNLNATEAQALASEVVNMYKDEYQGDAAVIFAPPYPFLHMVKHVVGDHPRIHVAAQNLHQEEKGAYTAEVSASMLTSLGVTHVLIGHSERRQYFGEDNALLAQKVDRAIAHGLVPIFCIGETLEQARSWKHPGCKQISIERRLLSPYSRAVQFRYHRLRTCLGHWNRCYC